MINCLVPVWSWSSHGTRLVLMALNLAWGSRYFVYHCFDISTPEVLAVISIPVFVVETLVHKDRS